MQERKLTTAENCENLLSKMKDGDIKPVYILMGKEGYYIDAISDYITSNLLKEEEKDFNLTILYGADNTAQQVMDQARRFPVMAKRQVVVVREAQSLKGLDALEKYMERPVPTTVLALCYKGGTIDGRKRLVTKAAAVGEVFTSEPPKNDRDIISFLNTYIQRPEYNATIDQRTAQIMAAHIGGDLKRMSSELDKLLLAFVPGAPRHITPDMVERVVGISKQYNVFEMRDALIQKDALKAHRIAKYFAENTKSEGFFGLLPQLFSFYQNLMLVYYIPKPITETAIMAQLGMKSTFAVRAYTTAMRNFSARKTLQIISKIREMDARSKGLDNISTSTNELLQELVSFILL